jgi:hypothetical protein
MTLERVKDALIIQDIPQAIEQLEHARAMLPSVLRKQQFPKPIKEVVKEKIERDLPDDDHVRFMIPYTTERQRDRMRQRLAEEIAADIIREERIRIVDALDQAKLWITPSKSVIIPTSERKVKESPPTPSKGDEAETMTRGVPKNG